MKKCLSGVLAICCVLTFVFCGCKEETVDFTAPAEYASVVQVTINPTVNLYLDANEVILAVEYVNSDAKDCYEKIETELVGSNLTAGLNAVIETAEADGFLEKNKTVTIDVVEAKQADKKLEILNTATDSVKNFITEKKIQAEVVLTETAQKEINDKAAAEKAAAEKAAAEKAAAEKAAAEKAAAEKAKKNPIKNLKKGVEYSFFKPGEDEMLITGFFITFNENGRYSYSMAPYTYDQYGEGEFVIYNGKKYYLAGGGGGSGKYTLTDEKIIMSESYEMVLTMTEAGELVVETQDPSSDYFKVGDKLTVK